MPISHPAIRHLIWELRKAREELKVLRAINTTVEAFARALSVPPPTQITAVDIIWDVERQMEEETRASAAEGRQESPDAS